MKISLPKMEYSQFFRKFGTLTILIAFVVISTILRPGIFLTWDNIISILIQVSIATILACGECSLIIEGSIDLSAGSVVALTGTVMAGTYESTRNLFFALVLALIIGAAVGCLNGFLIAKFDLPPFIVTLGTQIFARGIALVYAKGMPIPVSGEVFRFIGQGKMMGLIPYPIILCIFVVLISVVLVNRTGYGRALYAIGGNIEAAKASGINTGRIFIKSHIYMGVLAAVAGYILASRTNVGQPSGAVNYEFDAIIGAVLGGTSFAGGVGSIGGTVIGCMVMGVLSNIMNLTNVSPEMQYVVKGIIILLAVVFDSVTKKLSLRASTKGSANN